MGIPIIPGKVTGSGSAVARQKRLAEVATSTALQGVPVVINGSGHATESSAITDDTTLLAGFSSEPFHNLTTADTAEELNYGAVQGQTNAILIPVGAPPSDGKIGVHEASDEIEFLAKIRDADTLAITDVGSIFGLTKDSDNFWEVDKSKTTTGAGAIVTITELIDAIGTTGITGGKLLFRVSANNQLFKR